MATNCPKSGDLLTLHYVMKMPPHVKRFVIAKVNKTRGGPRGGVWKPSTESCICNMHYKDFEGPSRRNNNVLPCFFKQVHCENDAVPPRRLLSRTISNFTDIEKDCHSSNQEVDALYEEDMQNENDMAESDLKSENDDLQKKNDLLQEENIELMKENNDLKIEIDRLRKESDTLKASGERDNQEIVRLNNIVHQLQTTLQRLDPSILSSEQIYMYTGLTKIEFNCLSSWLTGTLVSRRSTSPECSQIALTFSQKLLMVLMRIRQNISQSDLACRFTVEQPSVSRIINQWIPMLAVVLSDLIKWPQTSIGPNHPPYNFLPNSVAIIDGTEMFIQRPTNLSTQKASYSDYKSHTTVKYLVAIDTFTGVFVFVSAGFSGNASDRFTIEHSGILDNLIPGQRLLADKGYTARDLFAQKRCFLTIPSFLTGGKFNAKEAMESRLIASVRIRVENAIRRLKEYKIFTATLSNRINKKLIDDMVTVSCALCNLKHRLIK